MQLTFDHILDISLTHQYFKNGLFKTIQFSLSDSTPKILRDLNIVLKPFSGGISVLASNTESLLSSESDDSPITLYINCSDPYYINYTEMPGFNPSDSILYFNNLNHSSSLHDGEFVGSENVIQLCSGKITIPSDSQDKNYTFKNASGSKISDENIKKTNSPNEFFISDYQEGLICVYENNDKIHEVYFNPKMVWKKPIGVLEIFPSKIGGLEAKLKQNYTVNFNNRKTIWKYFLVSTIFQRFNKLKIGNGKNGSFFGPPKEIEVGGNKALVFQSLKEIPLLEYSEVQLKLTNGEDSSDVIKILPRATPDQLFQNLEESQKSFFSHIYI